MHLFSYALVMSEYARNRELYDLFRKWSESLGNYPDTQHAVAYCDFARYVIKNPPKQWTETGSKEISGE